MAKTTDLTELKHMLVNGPLHFYYETNKAGKRVLRHIRVNWHQFEVPADGITIDVVPDNAVGSAQIEDGSVQMDDLNDSVKEKMHHTYDEEGEGIRLGGL